MENHNNNFEEKNDFDLEFGLGEILGMAFVFWWTGVMLGKW